MEFAVIGDDSVKCRPILGGVYVCVCVCVCLCVCVCACACVCALGYGYTTRGVRDQEWLLFGCMGAVSLCVFALATFSHTSDP